MRIRDRLFPEGTKIRKLLRALAHIAKRCNYTNFKKFVLNIKNKGLKNTLRQINNIIFEKVPVDVNNKRYQEWIKKTEPNRKESQMQRNHKFEIEPKISILVPMYNTPYNFFEELVDCLINQTYSNWELCLADGSPKHNEELEKIYKKDSRIKYKFLNENKGIAGNTNECIKMATGDYIALFDHDDLLPIFSLYEIVKCINEHPEVEFIYTDEDKITTMDKPRFNPHFKPDFSLDFLRANNYICHFSVFKKELMDKLEGERSKYDGAQDFDIILRVAENTKNIIHIPKVLYHWRVHPNSTASVTDAKPYAFEAGIPAIQDHLERVGLKGTVEHGQSLGTYRIRYKFEGTPKVSIIIPNKDEVKTLKTCINSILKKTTYKNYEIVVVENNSETKEIFEYYKELEKNEKIKIVKYEEKGFNYSKIINFGIKNSDGEYIVQLNNDTEIETKDWLEDLLGFASREDVGAVGVRLYYPDNTIQHAGIVFGVDRVATHLFRGLPRGVHGYFARESTIQDFSAVTAACMMAKRSVYEEVGYMDESFPIAFNDLDLCLKIRKTGKLIVYDPFVEVTHYESKTRGYEDNAEKRERFENEIIKFQNKWKEIYENGDPYYNKNFSINSCMYDIREEEN